MIGSRPGMSLGHAFGAAFMLHVVLGVASVSAQSIPTTPEQPAQPDAAAVVAATYAVDPAHTHVLWEVNHMGISMLQGMFGAQEGSLTLDPANLEAAQLDVSFAIADIAVTFPPFGEHLLSADFFDADAYETARFSSTSVTVHDENGAAITGDLTIKDNTHPVTIEARFVGAGINPMDENLHVGFTGTASILRSDFDLGAYTPAISDEVLLVINAAFFAD
jgi:polyisoprenoid-binding protein YceI